MFANFFSQWNPLNIYGERTELDDLVHFPLEEDETLMEDASGCWHRFRTPSSDATIWEKFGYWLHTNLNEKDYSTAIDHLFQQLNQLLLENPPTMTERLTEFYAKLEQLESLKNRRPRRSNDAERVEIEFKLHALRRLAYLIFTYGHCEHVKKKELTRKERFTLLKEFVIQNLTSVTQDYQQCLKKDRLLIVMTEEPLYPYFRERCLSLKQRLERLNQCHAQIKEIENLHLCKFTVCHVERMINCLRTRTSDELQKLFVEASLMIEHLTVNDQICPCNQKVSQLLDYLLNRLEKKKKEEMDPFEEKSSQLSHFISDCLLFVGSHLSL